MQQSGHSFIIGRVQHGIDRVGARGGAFDAFCRRGDESIKVLALLVQFVQRFNLQSALAQAGGVALLSLPEFKGKTAVYTGIDKAKFRAMAKPGDTLRLEVTFTKRRGPMAVAEGIAWVGDEKAAEAEIKCMVIND